MLDKKDNEILMQLLLDCTLCLQELAALMI